MDEVYSPAEDSFLLLECIKKENLVSKKCLDFGTGGGIQSIAMLKCGAKEVLAVDVNPNAVKSSKKNIADFLSQSKKNKTQIIGHFVGVKKSNLFSNVNEKFDFIAFNPPYVPSESIKWKDLDGGENGRVVIDKFLQKVKNYLNKKGILLILVSSLNLPSEIIAELKKKDFAVKIVGKKKLFFEELLVLRAVLNE